MKKRLKTLLLDNTKRDVAFQGKQLSSYFNIKVSAETWSSLPCWIYHYRPKDSCNDDYIGETARQISERVIDRSGRDKNYILKEQIEKEQPWPRYENFKIIGNGFRNNTNKGKLSEALWVNNPRLSLIKQYKSIPLKFFMLLLSFYCLFTCSKLVF